MNEEKIRVVYVDTHIDKGVSDFLKRECIDGEPVEYEEYELCEDNYKALLNSSTITFANIIVIRSEISDKIGISGEEFKLILRKTFPFIEVIVFSFDEKRIKERSTMGIGIVFDYDDDKVDTNYGFIYDEFYRCYRRVIANFNNWEKMKENKIFDKVFLEQFENSLMGIYHYNELSKSDIDELISMLRQIN